MHIYVYINISPRVCGLYIIPMCFCTSAFVDLKSIEILAKGFEIICYPCWPSLVSFQNRQVKTMQSSNHSASSTSFTVQHILVVVGFLVKALFSSGQVVPPAKRLACLFETDKLCYKNYLPTVNSLLNWQLTRSTLCYCLAFFGILLHHNVHAPTHKHSHNNLIAHRNGSHGKHTEGAEAKLSC